MFPPQPPVCGTTQPSAGRVVEGPLLKQSHALWRKLSRENNFAEAFIQSDLQLIRLSREQSSLGKYRVKGLDQGPNSCAWIWSWLRQGLNL